MHATQLYCGHHSLTIDCTVREGVSIGINLSVPIGDGQYWVNVYQEGAQFYGEPIPLE